MDAYRNINHSYYGKLSKTSPGLFRAVFDYFVYYSPVVIIRARASVFRLQSAFRNLLAFPARLRDFLTFRRACKIVTGMAAVSVFVLVPAGEALFYSSGNDPDVKVAYTSSIDVTNQAQLVQPGAEAPGAEAAASSGENILFMQARAVCFDANPSEPAVPQTDMAPSDADSYGALLSDISLSGAVISVVPASVADLEEIIPVPGASFEILDSALQEAEAVLGAVLGYSAHVDAGGVQSEPVEGEITAEPESSQTGAEQDLLAGSEPSQADAEKSQPEQPEQPEQSAQSAASYIWPAQGELTSRFGYRTGSVGSSNHKGIDIGGSHGQPIFAADDGEVIVSGWSNSYGYVVQIRHANGHITLYCHCSSLIAGVGDTVLQGQEIARMGATGLASGTHLHFEIIIDGVNVDPLLYLPS